MGKPSDMPPTEMPPGTFALTVPSDGMAVITPYSSSDPPPPPPQHNSTDDDKKNWEEPEEQITLCNHPMPSEGDFSFRANWKSEFSIMMKLALPCILANTSTAVMVITSQIFVGQMGVEQFAAAALANTWFNLIWSFMLGASTAMDTLASQAYGGKDYRSLLVWTYSGLIMMTLYCLPMAVGMYLSDHATAVLFHQGYGEVSDLVKEFCVALIPGMFPMIWSLMLMKFLQTQNSMGMPAAIILFSCLANIALTFGLVEALGFVGAAWATTAGRALQFVLMLAACIYQQHGAIKRGELKWSDWLPVSGATLRTACNPQILWEFFKLSMAGGAMNAFEAGAFDVTTAFAGALGTVATAAHAALLSIVVFCFNALPFAVSIAGTIRVGNLLGSGRPKQAHLSGIVCMVLGSSFQAVAGIVLGASQGQVVRIFTSDPEVLEAVKSVVYLAMAFQFSDGAFGVAQGVLRGMGKQGICVLYNSVGFWGFGVLIGYLLTFQANLGLTGLWIGLMTGDMAAAFMSIVALVRCNWHDEAQKAYNEIQEAAMQRIGTGDAREQLEADLAEGLVDEVDLSHFELEIKFFIVAPEDLTAVVEEDDQDTLPGVQSAPSVGRAGSMFVPGMMMVTRGASVTASTLAQSRLASITAARCRMHCQGQSGAVSNFRGSNASIMSTQDHSMYMPPTSSFIQAHRPSRTSNHERTSLASLAEGHSFAESPRASPEAPLAERRPRLPPRVAANAYAGSVAAALSRGGSVTAGSRTGSIMSGMSGFTASFIQAINPSFSVAKAGARYQQHPRASQNVDLMATAITVVSDDRPSRTSRNSRTSLFDRMSGMFYTNAAAHRGSSTSVAGGGHRGSNTNISAAGRVAAALARGGNVAQGGHARLAGSGPSRSQNSSLLASKASINMKGLDINATASDIGDDNEEGDELQPLPTSPGATSRIQIPKSRAQAAPKPAATTSALVSDMERGVVQKPKVTRRQRVVSLRRGIMHTDVYKSVQDDGAGEGSQARGRTAGSPSRASRAAPAAPALPAALSGMAAPAAPTPQAPSAPMLQPVGIIARAAREGSGSDPVVQAMTSSVSSAAVELMPASLVGLPPGLAAVAAPAALYPPVPLPGLPALAPAGLPAGQPAPMSDDQLLQMMAFLQQEMTRRQQQQQQPQ